MVGPHPRLIVVFSPCFQVRTGSVLCEIRLRVEEDLSLFDSSCLSRDVLTPPYHSEVETIKLDFILEISCQTLKSPTSGWAAAMLNCKGAVFFPASTVVIQASSPCS